MRIILTGAAGFIGSAFLSKLNSLGFDRIWVVDVSEKFHDNANLSNKKFTDFISREDLVYKLDKGHLKEADLIVHLGACADTTEMDRKYLTKNNLEYSRTLVKWALLNNKAFHYASSAAVYGDGKLGYDDDNAKASSYRPLNPYGESKLNFDRWLIENNLTGRVVGYRYFNVFGPNEYHKGDMRSMVSKAFDQYKADGKVKLFASSRPNYPDGSEERDFIYVKDVNEVMTWFIEHPDKHGIFNVGTGKVRTFKDLVTAVFTALGKEPAIDWIPMPEKLRGQYQYFTQAKLDNLRRVGYQKPFQSLEDSISDYVKNYLAQNKKIY